MKNIKHILVPVDFSVTSRNAYRYAVKLAEQLNAKLTVVHIIQNLVMVSDVMMAPFPLVDDKQLIQDLENFISEENAVINKDTIKGEVNINVHEGDPINILTELSEKPENDLIVMGTTGLSDILTKIFGSVSVKVSNKAHCPVVLVPAHAKWQPLKEILYASNFDSSASETIKEICDFALNINADIHFVNVKSYDPVFEIKEEELDWKKIFTKVDAAVSYETHTLYGNDTVKELREFSEAKGIHLLAFASRHRNFWGNLVHKSITENIAISTNTPIMVLHLDDHKLN